MFISALFTGSTLAQWKIYNASELPTASTPAFISSGSAGAGIVSTLIDDPDDTENKFLELLTVANADNGTWRYTYPAAVSAVTILMRVKSANDDGRRIIELDLENGGFRERLYLNQEDNKIRLQHSAGFGADNEFSPPGNASVKEWHIYRITKDAEGNVKLYFDENPKPIAVGKTAQATSNNYFRFGDTNGSHNISGLVDWVIWDESGTYAPGEGEPIPAGLKSSNWTFYDADVLPNEHVPAFSPSNTAGAGGLNTIVVDPDDEDNNLLEMITVANADNYMWSTPLLADTRGVTLIMKVKAANDVARRVVELDLHHNGIRERMYVNREFNRVRLNEAIGGGDGGEIAAPAGVSLSEWNIYRLTKVGGVIKLYLNEVAIPLAEGNASTSTSNQYFRFGDGNGSHNMAALVDWIIWDQTGAYAPNEGPALPYENNILSWDAFLSEIKIDGQAIANFGQKILDYEKPLPAGTTDIPVVTATANSGAANLVVTQADAIPGTATIIVTAENGVTQYTYTVSFRIYSEDATLSNLLADGQAITGFAPDVTDYELVLPIGTTDVPVISAVTNFAGANAVVTQADAIPGTAVIVVTAEDGTTTKTYNVSMRLISNNAVLTDLKVDNTTVTGFAANVFEYNVQLPSGTTTIPVVSAEAADSRATVETTQATALPGTATVKVTAEDGTIQNYTVNFTVQPTGITTPEVPGFRIYPNPANSYIVVEWASDESEAIVEIVSITGQVVLKSFLVSKSAPIEIGQLKQGTYLLQITAGQNRSTRLFVKN